MSCSASPTTSVTLCLPVSDGHTPPFGADERATACWARAHGQHAQDFLGEWRGALVCDDYSGYRRAKCSRMTAWRWSPGQRRCLAVGMFAVVQRRQEAREVRELRVAVAQQP